MELTIQRLSGANVADYFDFFDNVAFSDHEDWSWCYCTFYHVNREDEIAMESAGMDKQTLRNLAKERIAAGILNGYLAYADGKAVGWCNAGDKVAFKRLVADKRLWSPDDPARIKSVVCFVIAPDARRQGIATALLERVVHDAAADGYDCVEAYPANGHLDCYRHFHGHGAMYEKLGFVECAVLDSEDGGARVLRKVLK